MFRLILLSILLCFFLIAETLPQNNIIFNHLTVEEGLSQSSVTCILQDSKGFMWFGTQDGLNRFDGYNFKVFKNIPSDSTSLSDNFIFSIYETQDGVLYLETQKGGFHKYNPLTESFIRLIKDSVDLLKARFSTVSAYFVDVDGTQWIGGLGAGTGLKKINPVTGEEIIFKHNPSNKNSLSSDNVYSIFRDSKGNLWIGTSNGLDRLDELTGKFYHFRNEPENPNSLPDNWVWPIYEDTKSQLWIGTVRGGLSLFDIKSQRFINYKNDINNPKSLNDNFIFSINEDRSGVIWVGTNLGGINYFHPSTQLFDHYKHDPNNINSITDDVIYSLLVDSEGNYWIGTKNGGLNILDYESNEISILKHNPTNPNSILSNSIEVLMEDRSGNIWIGTYSSGLSSYDPKSKRFTHYVNEPSNDEGLSDNRIYSLDEDSYGNIWIGTYGGGVNKLDRKTGKFTHFMTSEGDLNSISSNSTWSFIFDDSEKLWIGTFGGGINVLDTKTQTFAYFTNDPEDTTSIADNNIIRVFKDNSGNMWFGTTKGFSKYIKSSNTFKNYNEEDGLANNFVYGILEDNNGKFWLSTNNGLSKFDPITEKFTNYYYEDGLQGNEFNQNAFARDQLSGRLLFGGINGLNIFNPDKLVDNDYIPPITFTEYIRYNTDDEEGKPIIEKGISERDSILLTYKDNIITLQFSALSYHNSNENRYQYKLEGFNKNWIQLGNNHSVTFTNLSPGEYNLLVKGSNNDGVWNEEGNVLYMEVKPPWWRTDFAYAAYAIIFIGILLGLRKIETDKREQKAKIRETELRMKATEAEKRAIEIENERKTKELEEARELQLSMLPKELPSLPQLEIGAFMRTATEVGGDYYDFIESEDGILNVGFGDATGHGLQAGTMVTLMKGFFTSDAAKLGLKEFMGHCTGMIKEIKLGRILMSFSLLRFENGTLKITSGGMPPIYYYDKEKNTIEEISIQGMPLGAMRKFSYNVLERKVSSGDILLLLTDGLPEQMNQQEEMYGYPRVKEEFKNISSDGPNEIINKLIQSVDDWKGDAIQEDDITFVVIKIK